MTPTKLPYLHLNARSRRITSHEIKQVFVEEITRFLPDAVDRDTYVRKVMI